MFQASLSYIVKPFKKQPRAEKCSSVVQHLPGMYQVMNLIDPILKSSSGDRASYSTVSTLKNEVISLFAYTFLEKFNLFSGRNW